MSNATETLGAFMRDEIALRLIRPVKHPTTGWRVGWLAERYVGESVNPETDDPEDSPAIVCERRRYDGPGGRAHFYRNERSYGFSGATLRTFARKGADRVFVVEVDTEDVHEYVRAQFTGTDAIRVKNRKGAGNRVDHQRHVPTADAYARHTRQWVHVYARSYQRRWTPGERPDGYPEDWTPDSASP